MMMPCLQDANVITVKREPSRPPLTSSKPHSTNSGCWSSTKVHIEYYSISLAYIKNNDIFMQKKVGKWYATAASYRPVFTVHGPAVSMIYTVTCYMNAYIYNLGSYCRERLCGAPSPDMQPRYASSKLLSF